MATAAADQLAGHPISALYASPLLRAQQSAAPWSEKFGLDIVTEDRVIEPFNRFEGEKFEFGPAVLTKLRIWPWIYNPLRPSWGEPYVSVVARMLAAIDAAWNTADDGEVVLVSHQMPIVMVQRSLAGQRLFHDPRQRRCSLSSITTLKKVDGAFVEVGYTQPGSDLLAGSIDNGAV